MKAVKIMLMLGGMVGMCFSNASMASKECVILLHGMGRTNHSMSQLASTLTKHHYYVVNDFYPSTRKSIDQLAETSLPPMISKCVARHSKRIHFVTHSMGGIILQEYLQHHSIPGLGSIVMLAPPNHGSPLADILCHTWIAKMFLGPAFKELTTKKQEMHLKNDHCKIGIIAGTYTLNPLGRLIFNEPNDGKVSVSSTQMKQVHHWIALPVSHTFMMNNKGVQAQVLYFLAHGSFTSAKKYCAA